MELPTSMCSAGRGAASSGQLSRPLPGAGEGAEGVQVAGGDSGGGHAQGPAQASRGAGTAGGCGAATQGATAPTSGLDLPQHLARSAGSSVTDARNLPGHLF